MHYLGDGREGEEKFVCWSWWDATEVGGPLIGVCGKLTWRGLLEKSCEKWGKFTTSEKGPSLGLKVMVLHLDSVALSYMLL